MSENKNDPSLIQLVCFSSSILLYSELYKEIFLSKSSKLHLDLSEDKKKDGIVDGATDRWIQVSIGDALIVKALNRRPTDHRVERRSFDHHEALTHCIQHNCIKIDRNANIQTLHDHFRLDFPDMIINNIPEVYRNAFSYTKHILQSTKKPKEKETGPIRKKRKLLINEFSSLVPNSYEVLQGVSADDEKVEILIRVLDAPKKSIFLDAVCEAIRSMAGSHESDFLTGHEETLAMFALTLMKFDRA
mmetsp:Transcript_6857/g.6159  ORF Transcript_6857/g.6159 Transcript_6857/m.6159 type:complete len:246 (-) Transcript_6857:110-847(-)